MREQKALQKIVVFISASRGGVEDTRLEAKAKDTKKISRPRTDPLEAKAKDRGHRESVLQKQVFKNFFQAISKKGLQFFFLGEKDLQKFFFRGSPPE